MNIEITDNITGNITIVDIPEPEVIDFVPEPQMPSDADRIAALESAMLDMILGGA